MFAFKSRFFFFGLVLLLGACGDTTIDNSSSAALKRSTTHIHENLPEAEKDAFSHAINSIIFTYYNHRAFKQKGDTRAIVDQRVHDIIHGKNVAQILVEFEHVKQLRAAWDVKQLKKEQAKIKVAYAQLAKVYIDTYRLYIVEANDKDRVFIDIEIVNDTESLLTSAVFELTVGSSISDTLWPPGKPVYALFPEGLMPGERAHKTIEIGNASRRHLPLSPILDDYKTLSLEYPEKNEYGSTQTSLATLKRISVGDIQVKIDKLNLEYELE